MLSLFTAPSATSTLASISEWSAPTYSEYSDIIPIIVGSMIGALLVLFIISSVIASVRYFMGYRGGAWEEHKFRQGIRKDEMNRFD